MSSIAIPARKRTFPAKSPIEVVDVPKLTPREFYIRRLRTGATYQQLTTLTDIGRQRISRIEKGDPSSLMYDHETPGTGYVPRSLTLALMGLESGDLIESLGGPHV